MESQTENHMDDVIETRLIWGPKSRDAFFVVFRQSG